LESGVAKREKSWDRVARWAGLDITNKDKTDKNKDKEEKMSTANEATIQDEAREESTYEPSTASRNVQQAGDESAPELVPASAAQLEIEQLRGEKVQLLDRLARLQAEFDNARKREQKERADAREYTIGTTVEPFLGVMDNFQLALKSEGSADQLRSGVELILKQMEDALRGLQVQPVETVGAQFDPRVHEALGSIETSEFPDHQVLEEIRRGYKIREKLLRPALVRIASNTAQVPA
jgi:molecular chaperone GrpE